MQTDGTRGTMQSHSSRPTVQSDASRPTLDSGKPGGSNTARFGTTRAGPSDTIKTTSTITSSRSNLKPPSVVICEAAELQGQINFGDGCIVHPGAFIDARGGAITFGEHNIIEEKARIVNKIRGKDAKG